MGWGGVRKKLICFGSGWEWVGFLPSPPTLFVTACLSTSHFFVVPREREGPQEEECTKKNVEISLQIDEHVYEMLRQLFTIVDLGFT